MPGTRRRRKRRRSPAEKLLQRAARLAKRGDIEGVRDLVVANPAFFDMPALFASLRRAIDIRARDDPADFAEQLHSKMTSTVTYLLYRAHELMLRWLDKKDREAQSRSSQPIEDTEGFQQVVMPIIELHRHLIELQQSHAATRRLNAMAQAKELTNRQAKKTPQKLQHLRPQVPLLPAPSENSVPVNRLAALTQELNGHKPGEQE